MKAHRRPTINTRGARVCVKEAVSNQKQGARKECRHERMAVSAAVTVQHGPGCAWGAAGQPGSGLSQSGGLTGSIDKSACQRQQRSRWSRSKCRGTRSLVGDKGNTHLRELLN